MSHTSAIKRRELKTKRYLWLLNPWLAIGISMTLFTGLWLILKPHYDDDHSQWSLFNYIEVFGIVFSAMIGYFVYYIRKTQILYMESLKTNQQLEALKLELQVRITDAENANRAALNIAMDATEDRERALATAKELKRSNQDLEDFAYVASHDLKSPLRGISSLISWVEEDLGDLLQGDVKDYIERIRDRIKRLENLLNDLLAYSQVGRVQHAVCHVDCQELVDDIHKLYQNQPYALQITSHDTLPQLHTPRAALELVLRNLINNAIKHHDGSEIQIDIECKDLDNHYLFIVKDNGPGIPAEHHQRIFAMFKTLQSRDKVEGSGMGLALIKKTVEQFKGRVWVESPIKDERGCAFYFEWAKDTDALKERSQKHVVIAEF